MNGTVVKMKPKEAPIPIPKAVEESTMEDIIDPKMLRSLPPNYEVIFDDPETAGKMKVFAQKLAYKHRNWTKERVMRKCFEEYPSTRIRIK